MKGAKLVALGSGTGIALGDNYSQEGRVVHDSHAEIVARRSLLRWLYSQIDCANQDESLVISNPSKNSTKEGENLPYLLKPFELWLYISLAPCGDGAIYSRTDITKGSTTTRGGRFRIKAECSKGMGSATSQNYQRYDITFDGLQRGDRALCHSCSDKIAKWNALGVQGALLSRLVPPIYLTGVVVSDCFHHENLARALFCRTEKVFENSEASILPEPFSLHHPHIREATIPSTTRHEKIQKKAHGSINWAAGDNISEVVNHSTGRCENGGASSRICKRALLVRFRQIQPDSIALSYTSNKALAVAYQKAKHCWL